MDESPTLFRDGCDALKGKAFANAAACFRRVLERDPHCLDAKHNLGKALFELGQTEEAVGLFREAFACSRPDLAQAAVAVTIPGDPRGGHQDVLDARRMWAEQWLPRPRGLNANARQARDGPARIGYLSSFFACDNGMKPVWGVINRHDRSRFEIHLFSGAPATNIESGYRAHAKDRFHDISGLSNVAAAELIGDCAIEVLVDLDSFSALRRLPLIALRPAPVMIAWYGLYATSGMVAYDYLVGDAVVTRSGEEPFFCEKVVRMPGTYLAFEVGYPVPPVVEAPCVKSGTIAFGCLASQYKINDTVVEAWARILHAVPDSILVLRNSALTSADTRLFVHDLFARRGINAGRVRLRGRAEHYEFLRTYDEIDIALDTFPFNGGTTTTEALWQGVPVVALYGDRWASRTSASLLYAAGLGDDVTHGLDGYVNRAVELGTQAQARDQLVTQRRGMRAQLRASAACDTETLARNMECLYAATAARPKVVREERDHAVVPFLRRRPAR